MVFLTIEQQIEDANRYLDYKIWRLGCRLDRQLILLKYGPNYIDDLLDGAIKELQTDKIIGE